MFTVKQIIKNVVTIGEVESVIILLPGSTEYEQAHAKACELGYPFPDYMELTTETELSIARDDLDDSPRQSEYYTAGSRDDATEAAIAILVSQDYENEFDGMSADWQFVYKGDRVFVMNQNGSTIESIK